MNSSSPTRRHFMALIAAALPSAAVAPVLAQVSASASNRVADRSRRMIARHHGIISFTRATAQQRAIAEAKARAAQEALRKEWARKNKAKAKVTPASQVSMATVVQDLNEPRIQAVKTAASPGAKASVVAVDVTTGNLVSGTVVNSSTPIGQGTNISDKVREAANDPNVSGPTPSEFANGNISLSAI